MKLLKKLPIRFQLLILAVSVILTMIAILSVYYSQNADIIEKKNSEYTTETISRIKQSISNYCDGIARTVTGIAYTSTVQNYLMETDQLNKYEKDKEVVSLLNNMKKNMGDGILDIVALSENGNYSSLNGGYEVVIPYIDEFTDKSSVYFTEVRDLFFLGQDYKCFLAGMSVISIDNFRDVGNRIGYFFVIVDADAIGQQIMNRGGNDTKFYLLDRDGKVFSSNDNTKIGSVFDAIKDFNGNKNGVFSETVNEKKCIVQIDGMPNIDGKIVSILPEESLFSELAEVREKTILMFALVVLVLSIPFTFIINNILHPLKKFMRFMKDVKSGNLKSLKKRIQLEGYAEMSVMAHEFNSMLDEIDSLTYRLVDTTSRLYQAELDKKQSELAFLQSQINPHFLYNTLEAIKGIASVRGVSEIRDMTKALSLIFRYSIKGTDEVCLEEEIDIIKSYIHIQKIRFANRFEVDFDFTSNALECKVPKMILQPLIENAIYHGLEPKVDKGMLSVTGVIDDSSDLVITIKDDGEGIEAETLERLRSELTQVGLKDRIQGYTRIGVINVNNRIRLKYGEKYGITIDSDTGSGTVVVLKIPSEVGSNV